MKSVTTIVFPVTLITLWLVLVGFTLLHISGMPLLPTWDEARHMTHVMQYEQIIVIEKNLWKTISFYVFYPPASYILYAFIHHLFPYSRIPILFWNTLLWSVASCCLYIATLRHTKSHINAYISCLFLLYIVIGAYTLKINLWEFMLDTPLYSMIIAMVSLMTLKKSIFHKYTYLVFGMIVGIIGFIKWVGFIFIMPAVLLLLIQAWKEKKYSSIAVFFVTASIVTLPWYFLHWRQILHDASQAALDMGVIEKDPQGIMGILYYIKQYFQAYPLLVGVNLGLLLILINKKTLTRLFSFSFLMLHISWIVPFLFHALILLNKNERYLLPAHVFLTIALWWMASAYFSQKIMNRFALLFTALILITIATLPAPIKYPSVVTILPTIIQQNPNATIGYFYEADNEFYNYATVTLLYQRLLSQTGKKYNYIFINNFTEPKYIDTCNLSREPEILIIYQVKTERPTQHSYKHFCGEKMTGYTLTYTHSIDQDTLLEFQKNN